VIVLRRPAADVVASLMRLQLGVFEEASLTAAMRRLDRKLDQIEACVPGVLRVEFDELADEAGCRRLWEHCLPYPFDTTWYGWVAAATPGQYGLVAPLAAYRPQLENRRLARHRIIVDMPGRA
jgi:hypothetical protein